MEITEGSRNDPLEKDKIYMLMLQLINLLPPKQATSSLCHHWYHKISMIHYGIKQQSQQFTIA